MKPTKRMKRIVKIVAASLGAATVLVGAMHAPFARPLLMRLGGCPMAGRMTPVESENARHMGLAVNRGTDEAPARPALGFTLDATTLDEVRAWAKRERVDCDEPRPGLVKCTDVPPSALGAAAAAQLGNVDELVLGFDTGARLVNVTTLRTHLDPTAGAREARDITAALREKLGAPSQTAGSLDAAHLGGPPAASIGTVAYRFSDYYADITTMNLPSSGPSLREHYMSARD
jgi:hypothetical protein